MNDKQKRFAKEYVIDLNATQAAIRAGYSENTANEQGARLLANVSIKKYINELQGKLSERNDNLADRVVQELAKIGFANIQDFLNGGNSVLELKHLEADKTAAVSKVKTTVNEHTGNITTEIAFHNKVDALEKLGRHLGIFEKDNQQQKPDSSINVTIVPPKADD